MTRAEREWAEKHIPKKAKLLNALRIDVETIRITYLEESVLKIILVDLKASENRAGNKIRL